MDDRRGGLLGWIKRSAGTLAAPAVGALIALIMLAGRIQVTLSDDRLIVKGPVMYAAEVAYEDIQGLNQRLELDPGQRLYGYGGHRVRAGDYHNDEFGDYRLYIYNSVPNYYIDVVTPKGHLVFNASSKDETEALYQSLAERLAPQDIESEMP